MAKRSSDHEARPDKGKIRILYLEVDGNNDSIQEALKTMVATMNKPAHIVGPARTVSQVQGNIVDGAIADTSVDESDEMEEQEDTADEEVQTVKRRVKGPKVDRNASIALVPDLNFRPNGKPSLRDFVSEKQPKGDTEHVVVFVYYLERMMEVKAISPGHVRTAFKDVNVSIPVDLKGTIRNLRRDKAWLKFSDIEDIKIATAGENFVEHDMPVSKAQS